eukprot:m.156947 g.156947  ORF g.156947 m.156947 type:complete len:71 (-) comp31034_c1_seq1:9-221(-)
MESLGTLVHESCKDLFKFVTDFTKSPTMKLVSDKGFNLSRTTVKFGPMMIHTQIQYNHKACPPFVLRSWF